MASGTIVGCNDYYEEATGNAISFTNDYELEWSVTVHVPNDFTIVNWVITNSNSATVRFGVEDYSNTRFHGYGKRLIAYNYTAAPTVHVHAVRTSTLTTYN